MADLVWREETTDTTGGTIVAYALWDRDTNSKKGTVTQIEPRENGDWVRITVTGTTMPDEAKTEFADMDEAKAAVESYA